MEDCKNFRLLNIDSELLLNLRHMKQGCQSVVLFFTSKRKWLIRIIVFVLVVPVKIFIVVIFRRFIILRIKTGL